MKHSKPIIPNEPVLLAPKPTTEDNKFSSYLTDIMSEIPRPQKIRLQGTIITMVIQELSTIT